MKSSEELEKYLDQLPADRQESFTKLISTIQASIPLGFEMTIGKMVNWVVPLSAFPAGYHCTPGEPLPFINVANTKGAIALYHMGVYAKPELAEWFQGEYSKHAKYKLDMGKSCIKFKKMDDIPFDLVGELMTKISLEEWIDIYEKSQSK